MVACSDISFISSTFSFISCTSWAFAALPQIITNYKNKTADGISPSFLLLWFLGDFLSFTSCLLNESILGFQIYLSIFFLCNDMTLCFQYYYYNSLYPKSHHPTYVELLNKEITTSVGSSTQDVSIYTSKPLHIRHSRMTQSLSEESVLSSTPSSYDSTSEHPLPIRTPAIKAALAGALLHARTGSALSLDSVAAMEASGFNKNTLGLVLAWACTVVYCSSRCPQLYKNYKRKSVEGISPLLFASALIGNLTYTFSILTSCEVLLGDSKGFLLKELPYILGSSGTIIFDMAYFYQKHIYRDTGRNTMVMSLENWSQIAVHDA